MTAGGLTERLRRSALRAMAILAAAAAAVLVLWSAVWQEQARKVSREAEAYAEAEGLAAARALLYDLSEEPDLKRLHRLESLYLETPGEARRANVPEGLVDFVWGRLAFPDTSLWEAARARGLEVALSDVEAARAAVYREEIRHVSARLQEDLAARVSFSEHLRGIVLRSAGGLVTIQAGENPKTALPDPPSKVVVSGRQLIVRLPLYVESRHWGEARLLMDRLPLLRLQGRLHGTLRSAFAALVALLGIFLLFLAVAWRWTLGTLRREVVEPVAELHRKMEGWARRTVTAEGPVSEEPARLGEVFDRMTRRIQEQQEELLRVHRLALLERLGAALSHEMNNALNPAVLRLDGLLLEGGGASCEDLRTLKGYVEAARKVLRDFAHATRGEPGPLRPVDPEGWLRPALELAGPAAKSAGVRLDGPDAEGPAVVGDPQSLVQVALNLILNAVDAARDGGGHVSVRLEAVEADRARLTVEDDGPGLPPEVRRRLFEPFVTTKAQGTGLGLYVVEALVRRMGGKVALLPREEGGTQARVELQRPSAEMKDPP